MFSLMTCERAESPPPSANWVLEPKWDGARIAMHVTLGHEVAAFTRTGKSQTGKCPHIEQALVELCPGDTVLDGEWVHASFENGSVVSDWGAVQSVIGRGGTDHDQSLMFVVFDVLRLNRTDVRGYAWSDRRSMIESLIPAKASPFVQVNHVVPSTQEAHAAFVGLGFEGTVAKRVDSFYVGARARTWRKIKTVETIDVVVTGFKPGDGKFNGMVGAVEFGFAESCPKNCDKKAKPRAGAVCLTCGGKGYLVDTLSRCSGMTDAVRQDMTDNPGNYLGKVIEVAHMGEQKSGVFRHPQFKGLRLDKRPRECVRQ